MIVRKMDFPSSASIDEARKILSAAPPADRAARSACRSMPTACIRTATRNWCAASASGASTRAPSKTFWPPGDDSVTFNYLDNGAPFALLGFGSSAAEVTVVAPSVLIDDLELSKVDDELPKLPIVPSPPIAKLAAVVDPLRSRSMKILSRYVFREILTSSFLATALATFVIFLQGIGRLFELLVRSAKGPAVIELFGLSLPPDTAAEHSVRRAGRHSGRPRAAFERQRNDRHALGGRLQRASWWRRC